MHLLLATTILAGYAVTASAQSVISAHSGVIHYTEGDVLLDGKTVAMKFGQFPDVKPKQELSTGEGRAEVLLTPGAFLRVGENSAIRMISNQLSATRLEVLKGEAVLELVSASKDSASAEVKGNSITILANGTETSPLRAGLFRFDTNPFRLRVYDGEALVKSGASELTLKRGHETSLEQTLSAEKFDPKTGDELVRWSGRRSGYLAAANVSAAQSAYQNGFTGGSGAGWVWNPWFGMFTFVPYNGIAYSPFGYGFWSPYTVGMYYSPLYYGGAPVTVARGGNAGTLNPRLDGHLGSHIGRVNPGATASAALPTASAASAVPTASASTGVAPASSGSGFSSAGHGGGVSGFSSAAGGAHGGSGGHR